MELWAKSAKDCIQSADRHGKLIENRVKELKAMPEIPKARLV